MQGLKPVKEDLEAMVMKILMPKLMPSGSNFALT